jgi:uncharacterized protein
MSSVTHQLHALLSRYAEIRLAMVFGSLAMGTQRPDSDLDLALLTTSPMSSVFKLELTALIGSEMGRPVDIIDLNTAGEPLLGQIFKGERILGEDAVYASLLSRHLLNTADFLPLRERILNERRAAWIG